MAPKYVCALIIYTGVVSVTGLLASWVMGVERTEIKMKSSINLFTISSDAAQAETTTLAGALAVTEDVLNTQKAQIITNIPGTASTKKMSATSTASKASSAVASAKLSWQTTAETAAVSAAGSEETTAGGTITLSDTIEKFKTPIFVTKEAETLETAKSTPGETVNASTQKIQHSKITTKNKATTFIDLTKGKLAPVTFIKRLKTTRTKPYKVETTTVRPQESTQAIKTSNGLTTINGATGITRTTMIQTTTGTKEKTVGKLLSTAGTGITIKSRHGQVKTPLTHDKTLYSAIIMGCILVICGILALIVFIIDFIGG